ncbi:hypothetical protein NMY22_g1163 [Coprinellus aureogranulatus]|nr:hypothetical protein NMY22_g1163 [Coprinellus aureogranulatus]
MLTLLLDWFTACFGLILLAAAEQQDGVQVDAEETHIQQDEERVRPPRVPDDSPSPASVHPHPRLLSLKPIATAFKPFHGAAGRGTSFDVDADTCRFSLFTSTAIDQPPTLPPSPIDINDEWSDAVDWEAVSFPPPRDTDVLKDSADTDAVPDTSRAANDSPPLPNRSLTPHEPESIPQPTNYYVKYIANANFGPNYGTLNQSNVNVPKSVDPRIIDSLPHHPDTSGRRSKYFENSRDAEMKHVYSWIANSPDLVLCTHAAAGMGKSTFAHHLGEDLRSKKQLAAALFMSFIPADWGPETIARLIAGEVGRIHPEAIPSIADAIEKFSGSSVSPQQLFDSYIRRPILSLQLSHPLTIIMDAVDEWKSCVDFLKQLTILEPSRQHIKFILLGRMQLEADEFPGVSYTNYPLPPASQEVMAKYFSSHFSEIKWGAGNEPAQHEVELLAEKAQGVFVYAWTVCATIADDFVDASPREVLEQTLQLQRKVGETELLAELYHGAIMRSFPKQHERNCALNYLQAIFVLEEPLPVPEFSSLINTEQRMVERIRAGLRALQTRDPENFEFTVYPANALFHLSVMEYFQSTSISEDLAFTIFPSASHEMMAQLCLNLLSTLPHPSEAPKAQQVTQYIVKKWTIHATHGMAAVEPGSEADWDKASLIDVLNGLPFEVLQRWAAGLLEVAHQSDYSKDKNVPAREPERNAGSLLRHVGNALSWREVRVADLRIACLELAVRLRHGVAVYWSDLGWAYLRQAETTYSAQSAERAIQIHRHAVQLATLDASADKAKIKHGLACSLGKDLSGTRAADVLINELNESISLDKDVLDQEALMLRPEGHPDRSTTLCNLALSLRERFRIESSIEDLRQAIKLNDEALSLCPEGHPDRSDLLYNLADFLSDLYKAAGSLQHLEESIQLYRGVLQLRPVGHDERYLALWNLGWVLYLRFQHRNGIEDLQEALELNCGALVCCPDEELEDRKDLQNDGMTYEAALAAWSAEGGA